MGDVIYRHVCKDCGTVEESFKVPDYDYYVPKCAHCNKDMEFKETVKGE